jgi:hypothetical protein
VKEENLPRDGDCEERKRAVLMFRRKQLEREEHPLHPRPSRTGVNSSPPNSKLSGIKKRKRGSSHYLPRRGRM